MIVGLDIGDRRGSLISYKPYCHYYCVYLRTEEELSSWLNFWRSSMRQSGLVPAIVRTVVPSMMLERGYSHPPTLIRPIIPICEPS